MVPVQELANRYNRTIISPSGPVYPSKFTQSRNKNNIHNSQDEDCCNIM